jgi:hypothetical protein
MNDSARKLNKGVAKGLISWVPNLIIKNILYILIMF